MIGLCIKCILHMRQNQSFLSIPINQAGCVLRCLPFCVVVGGVGEPLGSATLGYNEWQALWVSGSTLTVQEVDSARSTKVALPSRIQQEHQARGRGITVNVTSSRGNMYLLSSCQTGCVVYRTPVADDAYVPVPLEGHRDLWVRVPGPHQTLLQVVLIVTHSQNTAITRRNISFFPCCGSSWTRLRVARVNETSDVRVWSLHGDNLTQINTTTPRVTIRPDDQVFFSFQSADTAFWSLGCDTRLARMQDLWSTSSASLSWVLLACVLSVSLLIAIGSVYTWHTCKRRRDYCQDNQSHPETPFSWWQMGSVSIREDGPRTRPSVVPWSAVTGEAQAVQRGREGTPSSLGYEGMQRNKRAEEIDFSACAEEQVKSLRGRENSPIGRGNFSLGMNNSASARKLGCDNFALGLCVGTSSCNNGLDHTGSPATNKKHPSASKNSPEHNKYGASKRKAVGPERKHNAHSSMDALDGKSGVPSRKKDVTTESRTGSDDGHSQLQKDHQFFAHSIKTHGRPNDLNKTQNAQTRSSDKHGHIDKKIQSSQQTRCPTPEVRGRSAVDDQQHRRKDVASADRRKKQGGECRTTQNDTRMVMKDKEGSKFRRQYKRRPEIANGDVASSQYYQHHGSKPRV
ncbi:uncharacterized protein [Procambarus clarkii]|uniref:uncharacterized protein n=1 Tax=Procambarus clarkii TaxID=6728 RepID=UPI003743760C